MRRTRSLTVNEIIIYIRSKIFNKCCFDIRISNKLDEKNIYDGLKYLTGFDF